MPEEPFRENVVEVRGEPKGEPSEKNPKLTDRDKRNPER
jgi:hypothetical protein